MQPKQVILNEALNQEIALFNPTQLKVVYNEDKNTLPTQKGY